jgi:signal-transduction protein with cAMP-binding, CBS, and nucleotidyltransferase domain
MKQLSLIEISFFLKKVALFEELDLDLLVAIADKMSQDIYDENEVVFEKNQKAIRMYFIAKGSVHILDDRDKIVKTLVMEDFFGDEALFSDCQRHYKTICAKDTLLLTISKTNLFSIISECPSIATSLLNYYARIIPCRFFD